METKMETRLLQDEASPPLSSSSRSSSAARKPITEEDTIIVKGRYFFHQATQERFLMKGIAFPVPRSATSEAHDVGGWNRVLDQLATELPHLNTIRVYDLNCNKDHADFLTHAAKLGLYVMVPLTASSGPGVLDRGAVAPKCYPHTLFQYGQACIDHFSRHPNVIGGLVGNEVMNSPKTWASAPCVYAYARDLKQYQLSMLEEPVASDASPQEGGQQQQQQLQGIRRRAPRHYIPLVYASQHDASLVGGPSLMPSKAMHITADVLTCEVTGGHKHREGSGSQDSEDSTATVTIPTISAIPTVPAIPVADDSSKDIAANDDDSTGQARNGTDSNSSNSTGVPGYFQGHNGEIIIGSPSSPTSSVLLSPAIDVFGINIESWCSSLQTFRYNEDGVSESSYYTLYNEMVRDVNCPIIFTEIGCSKRSYNRDNGMLPQGYRDWKQVPAVLDDMSLAFSGFCAYAYDGNPDFRMMADEHVPWDGHTVLTPGDDFKSFGKQLDATAHLAPSSSAWMPAGAKPPSCRRVWNEIHQISGLRMYPADKMPTYAAPVVMRYARASIPFVGIGMFLLFIALCIKHVLHTKSSRSTSPRSYNDSICDGKTSSFSSSASPSSSRDSLPLLQHPARTSRDASENDVDLGADNVNGTATIPSYRSITATMD